MVKTCLFMKASLPVGDLSGVVFVEQLPEAVRKLNPQLPESAVDSVVKSVTKSDIGDLVVRNQAFYKLLRDGVRVEYQADGEQKNRDGTLGGFRTLEEQPFCCRQSAGNPQP